MVEESPGIDCNDRTRLSKQGNHSIHIPSVPSCNVLRKCGIVRGPRLVFVRDARDVSEPINHHGLPDSTPDLGS